MTTILIMEGNTPDIIATGVSGAARFVRSFLVLAPAAHLRVVSPYAAPIGRDLFDEVDGVVFTGSGTGWGTANPQARKQAQAMETSLESGLPVWGSCNGMQLAAVVLGGEVAANPKGLEVGIVDDIELTRDGSKHPMMAGRADVFAVPTVHRDIVQRIPSGATITAGNAFCQVQAMVYERDGIDFWGTQYHPELNSRDVAAYIRAPGIFTEHHTMVDDLERAETDAESAKRLGATPDALAVDRRARELVNWLDHVENRSR